MHRSRLFEARRNILAKMKPHVKKASVTKDAANGGASPLATTPTGYTAAQLRTAYGINQLGLDGTGMTVCIVDAFNYSGNIQADFAQYDKTMNINNPGVLTVVQLGTQANADWSVEMILDCQAVHAIAPKAKLILVCAKSDSTADLMAAIQYCSRYSPCAVSNSWGGPEWSTQSAYDSYFSSPNCVYLASSGTKEA